MFSLLCTPYFHIIVIWSLSFFELLYDTRPSWEVLPYSPLFTPLPPPRDPPLHSWSFANFCPAFLPACLLHRCHAIDFPLPLLNVDSCPAFMFAMIYCEWILLNIVPPLVWGLGVVIGFCDTAVTMCALQLPIPCQVLLGSSPSYPSHPLLCPGLGPPPPQGHALTLPSACKDPTPGVLLFLPHLQVFPQMSPSKWGLPWPTYSIYNCNFPPSDFLIITLLWDPLQRAILLVLCVSLAKGKLHDRRYFCLFHSLLQGVLKLYLTEWLLNKCVEWRN